MLAVKTGYVAVYLRDESSGTFFNIGTDTHSSWCWPRPLHHFLAWPRQAGEGVVTVSDRYATCSRTHPC